MSKPSIGDSAIPNVLAERYATKPMRSIWSAEGRIVLEREFWIAVMKAQRSLGLDIPQEAIESYEKVKDEVNLLAIMERERITRHDVKARIEEFCDLAGHEHIHKGMTSRDLTENVEQLQVHRSLQVIRDKAAAVVLRFSQKAKEYRDLVITARTHNVAAQTTTLGKRLATFGEEMLRGFEQLENLLETYPVRGLKGAVGTQLDQLNLFNGDREKVAQLEDSVVGHLGIARKYNAVGQVYPRSLDFEVVSLLCGIAGGAGSFAKTLRLMAGHELAGEGFAKGQVGSSAMPHKMNSRSCERINGFHLLLKGYVTMASGLAGDQWNEGDVSCSVVRRVMLPDAFFAMDGLLETMLTVLDQMEVYASMIEKENSYYLPFLLTTTFLMEAVKAGTGRETAHEVIKKQAVDVVRALRNGETSENNLVERLAGDDSLGLDRETLDSLVAESHSKAGAAREQVDTFVHACEGVAKRYPGAASYSAGPIL